MTNYHCCRWDHVDLSFSIQIHLKRKDNIGICLTANKIFYFDSLNVNFLFTSEVTKFLLRNKKELFFNKIKTQVDNSNTCGIHCLVFCLYMSKLDVKEKSFITFFSNLLPFSVSQRESIMTSTYYSII